MAFSCDQILPTKVAESCRPENSPLSQLARNEDPLFFSADFEQSLWEMAYSSEQSLSPSLDSSPSRILGDQYYDPLDDFGLPDAGTYLEHVTDRAPPAHPKMEPITPPSALPPRRHHPYARASPPPPTPTPRRGRPKKATSHSKQANYARNYREMKKAELERHEMMVQELRRENDDLRQENAQIKTEMAQLNREMRRLRDLLERDQLNPILALLGGSSSNNTSLNKMIANDSGVCLHLGANRVSLEFCERCEQKNRNSAPSTSARVDTPLFNGDFDSIVQFIE